jgi:hypothetical protein
VQLGGPTAAGATQRVIVRLVTNRSARRFGLQIRTLAGAGGALSMPERRRNPRSRPD